MQGFIERPADRFDTCVRVPSYLLRAAECAMSPSRLDEAAADLQKIAANPFSDGRAREKARLAEVYERHARVLIWC